MKNITDQKLKDSLTNDINFIFRIANFRKFETNFHFQLTMKFNISQLL